MTRKQHLARIASLSSAFEIMDSVDALEHYRCQGYRVKWWDSGTAYKSTLRHRLEAHSVARGLRRRALATGVKVFSVWVKVK